MSRDVVFDRLWPSTCAHGVFSAGERLHPEREGHIRVACKHVSVKAADSQPRPHQHHHMDKQQHVVFFHPDLGIGGAERLVIDAAVGLQNRGHKVTIFTSHRDRNHCFDEARDGKLPPAPRCCCCCGAAYHGSCREKVAET